MLKAFLPCYISLILVTFIKQIIKSFEDTTLIEQRYMNPVFFFFDNVVRNILGVCKLQACVLQPSKPIKDGNNEKFVKQIGLWHLFNLGEGNQPDCPNLNKVD